MALDRLRGELVTFTRDELVQKYLRDYRVRAPGADTREGTQAWIDALVMADVLAPLYANAVTIANDASLESMSGKALEREAATWGIPRRLPATGAVGFVRVATSAGSWTIFAGDELRDKKTGVRFKCLVTGSYADGAHVPVGGIDTGPKTNLGPDSVLTWLSPRPGAGPTVAVLRQPNGAGLSNGRNEESDGELRARIRRARATPPASGNDAEYQATIEATPDLPVQKAFTYPALFGPGSKAFVFTVRPERRGGSRVPNAAQIAQALVHLVGRMPADDAIFACEIVAEPVELALRATWAPGSAGWADADPWPVFARPLVRVAANPAPDAETFTVTFVGTTALGKQRPPVEGDTFAFFDRAELAFRRKRVRSVVRSNTTATITCDMSNGASDPDYVPQAGEPCCPWSDSLASLTEPVAAYFETLGPGEQVAIPFDFGMRQRRSPASPLSWPSELSIRLLAGTDDVEGLLALRALQDSAVLEPAMPRATRVGIAGAVSYLLTLDRLLAFPQ